MKKSLLAILCCFLLTGFIACVKTNVLSTNNSTVKDSTKTLVMDSATRLLTGQIWVYYEYFTSFDSVTTTLAWKTNRTSNNLNLAKNQVRYYPDSTYWEIDQSGDTLKGTWKFLNNETGTQVVNSQGTFISAIQKLNATRFEWLAPTGNYGVMVPKNETYDTTGGPMQLLTAKSWVYDEYFYNFNQLGPQLVWKTNKANSPFNLSKNIVKYNSDWTYSETDQYGNILNGTWQFLNNMTETATTNVQGTFYAYITRLDTARFEWLDSVDTYHYGEMVHQ